MFETSFSESTTTPIPPNLSIENGLPILHDFETVIRFSPDCRGCKPIPAPKASCQRTASANAADKQYYEVSDDLPFIPKKLWSGGVRYNADFLPVSDGCDITIHAPGGFTSTNHWRLVREPTAELEGVDLDRVRSKDLLHADTAGSGWYVQIVSDAVCSRTYAGFVKGYLKNTHARLQQSFIEKLRSTSAPRAQRRPGLGRRQSSVL